MVKINKCSANLLQEIKQSATYNFSVACIFYGDEWLYLQENTSFKHIMKAL